MPLRLIGFILVFGVFLVFVAFNLGNTCDINFGFTSFKNVPVFFTVFSSFILGMFCSLPFMFGIRSKKKNKAGDGDDPAGKKTKKRWGKKKEQEPEVPPVDSSFSDGGPYGVN